MAGQLQKRQIPYSPYFRELWQAAFSREGLLTKSEVLPELENKKQSNLRTS
jgi:hypothetical protein